MEAWSALILGLAGSLHCAGMCGPLMVALSGARRQQGRLVRSQVVHQLGRLAAYMLLGLAFGMAGKALVFAGFQRWVSLGLGVAVLAVWGLGRWLPLSAAPIRAVSYLKSALGRRLHRPGWASQLMLGGLNGLLPCGLVYVACAGAAATGGLLSGASYMLVFGLGTVPMMLTIGLGGSWLQRVTRFRIQQVMPTCVVALSLLLILRGLALGIPYLSPSPVRDGQAAACCR